MHGASTGIARLCLWNPASSQAQTATEFPASMLAIISIYMAAAGIQEFKEI
jgi:hypothetical protein